MFRALWNHESTRDKCRAVLDATRECMLADAGTENDRDVAAVRLAELKALRNLAPGDFRTVRQEQYYLGGDVTNEDRIAALKEECALKKDGDHSATIGF